MACFFFAAKRLGLSISSSRVPLISLTSSSFGSGGSGGSGSSVGGGC